MTYAEVARRAEAAGLALRGGFHPNPGDLVPPMPDGQPAGTLLMLGWTGGVQWPVFAAAPELADGAPHPLDRWSRRLIDSMAQEFGAAALYPFGGPPFQPFLRWAPRAEAVHASPLGLLMHPEWGLWHAWRGALAFAERLDLPAPDRRASPCDTCATRPCRGAAGFAQARRACPVGVPYGDAQAEFHRAAFERRPRINSEKSCPD